MAIQVRFRRGTATQHNSFTGANGEITVDTTNKTLRVHDGATVGGVRIAKFSDLAASTANLQFVTTNIVPSANLVYNLGSPEKRWKDLYLSGNTINLGGFKIQSDVGAIVFKNQANITIANFDSLNPSVFSNVNIANSSVINSTISNVVLNGVLGPQYGGTGFTSLTQGGLLYAANTSAFAFATGADGEVLTIANGVPVFSGDISVGMDGGSF